MYELEFCITDTSQIAALDNSGTDRAWHSPRLLREQEILDQNEREVLALRPEDLLIVLGQGDLVEKSDDGRLELEGLDDEGEEPRGLLRRKVLRG